MHLILALVKPMRIWATLMARTGNQPMGVISRYGEMKVFTRRSALFLGAATLGSMITPAFSIESGVDVMVWKDPYCGCCGGWMAHMRANGFSIQAADVEDMDTLKNGRSIPPELRSCHTAQVQGYVVEGHVPATAINRLLKMKPANISGLAVAGMPLGSPGMSAPEGYPPDHYDVISFGNGQQSVFMRFAGEQQL